MSPLVSIFCLSYNQANFIKESLDSISSQTYTNYEILICDDNSKDNSVEVIEQWISENLTLSISFVKHLENKGICKSLNELLSLCKGKYIQMLALDDILLPNKLQNHKSILENSSESQVMVFTDSYIIDEHSQLYENTFIPFHYHFLEMKTGNFYDRISKDNFIPAMSCLLKTEIIKNEGGWDENLTFEDYDMWLRLSKKFDFIYHNEKSCQYRLHSNNTHKKRDLIDYSLFDIYSKHYNNPLLHGKTLEIIEQHYELNNLENKHIDYLRLHCKNILKYRLIAKNYDKSLMKLILFSRKKAYQFFKI